MRANRRAFSKRSRFWSGNRISYICTAIACLLFVFFSGGRIPYAVFWAVALIPALSLVYAGIARFQASAQVLANPGAVMRGQTAAFECHIKNRGPLAQWHIRPRLRADRDLSDIQQPGELSLLPFGRTYISRSVTPRHRGVYTLTVASMRAGDMFGLVRLPARRVKPAELVCFPLVPDILPEWRKHVDPLCAGMPSAMSDEPSVDARAYQYGDSMRRIHWNLTLQKMELMTRIGEESAEHRLCCIIDLSRFEAENPLDCEDALVERFLSVVNYACRRGIETTAVYGDKGRIVTESGNSERLFARLHEAMARVEFVSEVPASELLSCAAGARLIMLFSMGMPGKAVTDMLPKGVAVQICAVRTHAGQDFPQPSSGDVRVTRIIPDGGTGGAP